MSKQKILVLDIGNRSVKTYIAVGDELGGRWSFGRGRSDWVNRLEDIAARSGSERAVVISVIPDATELSMSALQRVGLETIVVHGEMELPIALDYGSPGRLGADRIAAAVGAWQFYGDSADEIVIVDAGTAVTVDLVRDRKFLGGAILPGVELIMASLHSGTAQLPRHGKRIKPQFPGKGTEQCIAAGTVSAVAGAIEFLWQKLVRKSQNAILVLTGGDASRIAQFIDIEHQIDTLLLVRGAVAIHDFVIKNGE